MRIMSGSALIVQLPGEIHNHILSYLDSIARISLKLTSVYFNSIIPKLSSETLQAAEWSTFASDRDLYGCYDCLRLRESSRFADNQLRKKKRRFGAEAPRRFCVECGLTTRDGRVPPLPYVRGNHIIIRGVAHVVCMYCARFKLKAVEEGYPECNDLCVDCWRPRQEARRRAGKDRRRAEKAARREQRRRIYGSDSEFSCPSSSTSSEDWMDSIQAEADMYMNSPKASSD